MKLNILKNKFPVYTDRLVISVLGKREMEWYAKEIRKPYFSRYIDNKSVLEYGELELRLKLLSLITTYSTSSKFIYEFRLVIKDIDNKKPCGGITIQPINKDNIIEISYWITEDNQGKGYATEALSRMTQFIHNVFKDISGIELIIQEANDKSIAVANKCGYENISNQQGRYCTNLIYMHKA